MRDVEATGEHGEPTPCECLLYGLGQLYRRWHAGLPDAIPPERIDVQAVARFLGIWADVEFVQTDEDPRVEYIHFASEVLVIDHRQDFPWQLISVWEWGQEQEHKEFWKYFH